MISCLPSRKQLAAALKGNVVTEHLHPYTINMMSRRVYVTSVWGGVAEEPRALLCSWPLLIITGGFFDLLLIDSPQLGGTLTVSSLHDVAWILMFLRREGERRRRGVITHFLLQRNNFIFKKQKSAEHSEQRVPFSLKDETFRLKKNLSSNK